MATMVLHNICIDHGISWETEFVPEIEEIQDGIPIDLITSGH